MHRRNVLPALVGAAVGGAVLAQRAHAAGCTSGPCYPQSPQEAAAGVTPSNYNYLPGQPERYIPSFTYGNTTGTTGTDFTSAFNTAASITGQPVILGPNLYTIKGYLSVPAEQKVYGQGLNETGLCFPSNGGSSPGNPFISDTGNAAKIELRGFTLYCNNATYLSRGIYLGYGTYQYGTEGYLDQILVRNLPVQALAFDINANVGEFGNLYAIDTAGIRIIGSSNSALALENSGALGFTDTNGNITGFQFQDGVVYFMEYEAPSSNILLMTLCGNAIVNLDLSFAASTTLPELFYLVNNSSYAATNGVVNVVQIYYKGSSGSYATFTHGFYDQASGKYFGPGNPSSSSDLKTLAGSWNYGQQFNKTGTTIGLYGTQILNKLKGTMSGLSGVTSATVSLGVTLSSSTYQVFVSPDAAASWWISAKTTTSFTVSFASSFTGAFDWTLEQ